MTEDTQTAVCPTPCDPDCDAVCHEDHVASHRKRHWPYDCPAADDYLWDSDPFTADAIKRLRTERDEARAQLAAARAEQEGSGVCGMTFGRADRPVFTCTLPPHPHSILHANANATAYGLGGDTWVIQRALQHYDMLDDRPTTWAYQQACTALHAQRERAEKAESQLGEPEYGVRGLTDLDGLPVDVVMPEQVARSGLAQAWADGEKHLSLLMRRKATDWTVIEAACQSCGRTESVLGNPPLCKSCAVYGTLSSPGPRRWFGVVLDAQTATEAGR